MGVGAFPIAGQWLVCANPAVVDRHFEQVENFLRQHLPAQPSPTAILDGLRADARRPIDFHAAVFPDTVYVGQQVTSWNNQKGN